MTKRLYFASLAVIIAALLSSCTKPKQPVAIGINAWPGYEYIYLAKVKGFYEQQGVSVKIVEYNSLADARQAYERGHLDGLACTIVEHCQILDNSTRNPRISLINDYSNGGDVLLAHKSIATIEDLRGKRIGLEIGSLGIYLLARVLEEAGLNLADVDPVSTDQLSLLDLFNHGKIDAAITYPPHSVSILKAGSAHEIFSSADIPNEIIDILVFDKTFLKSREEDARAVIEGIYSALDWTNQNKDAAYGIMADREGISKTEFAAITETDIHVVSREEQSQFFNKESPLNTQLAKCDAILRSLHQLTNPPRYQDTYSENLYRGKKSGRL